MALTPFDGELDAPVAGLAPFTGKLDDEPEGIVGNIKKGLTTAKNYGLAVAAGAGEGVANTEAGIGTFIQAPAANTLSGVVGGAALADRGITAASNYFSPGSASVSDGLQKQAQMASQFAAEERAKNADSGIVANLGLGMQGDGRERVKAIQDFNRENNPELVRQQQAMAETEGFLGALEGIKDNPMAFTHTLSRSAPDMAVGAGIAKAAAGGIAAAGGSAARQVAGASTAGILSESASSANQTREGVYQQVASIPLERLAASDRFNALLAQTGDATKAREILANELADQAPLLAGAGTAAGSVLTNKLFGGDTTARMIAGTQKTTAKDVLKNMGQESTEEALQGIPEDLAQHGAVVQADPSAKFDLGKTIAENAAAGLAMGSGGSVASYVKDNFGKQGGIAAPQLPDTGPLSRSANVALATGAATTADSVLGVPAEQVPTQAERDIAPKSVSALDRVFAIDQQLQTATPEQLPALQGERDSITAAWPAAVAGAGTSFSTESGSRIKASYALMDAGDLTTSHDEKLKPSPAYPQEMQPRERDRAASELQISGIAQRLDPARLGESADAATGAPIVGADGLVESGNARTIALKRVYRGNPAKAEEYKQFLRDNAARFGLTPEAIDAMPSPVLVRIRETPVDRAEFARQANASTVAQMSSSEQARSDAARLDNMDDLRPDDGGDFIASREFIRRFVSRLPGTEQAGMIDASGQLSQAGYARIRNAVLAKAYGDSPVLARMVESLDDNLRNVGKALMQAAPAVAKLRQDVNAGALFDADITPDLMAAVEELSRLKDAGRSISDALAQAGMFGDGISPEARDLLRFLDENIRKPRKIVEFIQRYAEALRAAGNPNQGSLLGEAQAPAKGDLLNAARGQDNAEAEPTGQPAGNESAGAEAGEEPGSTQGGSRGAQGNAAANDAVNSDEWRMFPPESGTLGIPRAQMPQVAIRLRPAMLAFLETQGISHHREDVAADELKPTQAEYSTVKAERAAGLADDRSDASAVLLSSDGYVLDGHHRWIAKAQRHQPINVIRFDAPIDRLMDVVREFSGATVSTGSPELLAKRTRAVENFYDAAGDLAQILTKHTRAAMVPEKTPDLMPTLVKLFDSAFDVVGTDIKRATAWVKERLKAMPELKKVWNKIAPETYRKAALQAVESYDPNKPAPGGQMGLFAAPSGPAQPDLFRAPAAVDAKKQPETKVAMIDGRPYDMQRDNYKVSPASDFVSAGLLDVANKLIDQFFKGKQPSVISDEARSKAEAGLNVLLGRAKVDKPAFDQSIIDIAKQVGIGQMIAPLKSIGRAAEKVVIDYEGDVNQMADLLRATIIVERYEDAGKVLSALVSKYGQESISKIKNKAGIALDGIDEATKAKVKNQDRANFGGYADVSLIVKTPSGVLAEVQINVPAMMAVKDAQGHKLYEAARQQPKDSDREREIDGVMKQVYDESFASAVRYSTSLKKSASDLGNHSLTGPLGPMAVLGSNERPSSDSANQAPSGNSTKNPPSERSANRQPAGNLSGNFISTTSNDSIADGKNTAYTDDSGNTNGVPNEQHAKPGARSPETQEPGAVQQPAAQREAERVRAGNGGRDRLADRESGASDADAWEVGQPAADGTRAKPEDGGRHGQGNRPRRNAGVPAGRDIPVKTGRNYAFGDADLTYDGSWLVKARQNVEALELLKQLEKDGRQATRDEQAILAKFIGWGSSEIANSLFGDKLNKDAVAIASYERAAASMAGKASIDRYAAGYYDAYQLAVKADPSVRYSEPITRVQLDKGKPDMAAKKWLELRDRIKAALTPDEWKEASRSTQYAHYTSKPIVTAMWDAMARMGFQGGSILEPGAGIGVFPGLMSPAMMNNSVYTGIEFDSVTGGILKQLFPDERILVESFVDSNLPAGFYDVAAGNPPFNNTAILADPKYKKFAFALHDYFFAKTIDSVKPGGLVMFVTSRYTMDKLNDKARAYMAERADLVGAIRLPQTAFKKNAGTDVVTDVLFLRKKVDGETFEHAQPWAKSVPMVVGKKSFPVNEYFHAHPEMVLGTPSDKGKMANSPEPQYTVEAIAGNIDDLFAKAAQRLPANIYAVERGSTAEANKVREIDFNPKAQKEGNFYVTEAGALMQREGGVGVRAEKHQKSAEVIKDFVGLRDALKQSHYDQLNDGEWEKSLAALQKSYRAFVKKHGHINQFTEMKRVVKATDPDTGVEFDDERSYKRLPLLAKIQDDPDYSLVMALESINEETGAITESPFLTDRVLGRPLVQEIKTPADALLAVLNDIGHVDIDAIAERLDMDRQDAVDALGTMIYEDPAAGWVMADEFLSGNVKKKLQSAQEAVKSDRRFERNIEALLAVQPVPVPPSDITVSIGMNWIPAETYAQFLQEKTGVKARVIYNERTGQWAVDPVSGYATLAATQEWGTPRRSADEILQAALTGAPIRITETAKEPGGGTKTVFLADATEAANHKLAQMRAAFGDWIWQDGERADKLVRIYNDTFNTIVPRAFDGKHLTLPGISKRWNVFDHVKRGAWRIIQSGNTYLAHAVGSGKTFQMVISAMEQKRLGLIKKPMMVVPNHMLQQFAREWVDLYPAARLMVADEKNFHTENRRRFVSRVAMSDLDGVIITHSAFKLLDLDPEFKQKMIEQELDYLRAAFDEAGGEEGKKSRDPKIKQIESKIEKMEQKLEAAMSGAGKDQNVRFDQLGVDMLYVDEAHEFRKLAFTTQRQVKGIDSSGSDRAFDLWMKTRWLEEKKPGRSLVMASGTPVTNTLAELYSVQRFMAPAVLEERGLDEFDAWASMFGQEHTEIEADASGKYAPVTRFSKFVNVPELTQMFREFADVLTSDHLAALLGDKRPKVMDGSRKIVITPQTGDYKAFKQELKDRLEVSRAWKPSRDEPNNPDPVIRIIGDGRLAAIDMRFIDPALPSDPESKLNRMADEVIRVFKETANNEYNDKEGKIEPNKGATQIVFSDLGFGAGVAENRGFNARAWFEKRLRDAGVPPAQVAFMSDNKKSTAKLKLFKDINAGRVRIVVGSSKNMGTGVNAQQRLIALHHLDTPWYPADLEQREGRIVRQGNKNQVVQLYAYSTKGSYDAVMWQMLASKQRFIDQALSGDSSVRSIDDLSESSQFQIATAMTSDDERAIQLAGLRAEIEKLQRLYRAHEEQRARMKQEYDWAGETIRINEQKLPEAERAAESVQDLSGDKFAAKADGKAFVVRKEFGEALMARFKDYSDKLGETWVKVGEISGFDIMAKGYTGEGHAYRSGLGLMLPEPVTLTDSYLADPVGVSLKATNALANMARLPAQMRQKVEEAKAKRNALEARITAPFPMAEMLADKVKEGQDLEAAMLADQNKLTGIEREQQLEDEWQKKTGAITPLFSRGTGSGMALRDLQAVADRIANGLKNLPRVHVLESPAALSAKDENQKSLRDFIRKAGAWEDVEGATHNGEIYLFASGLADEARAEHVLATHEVTHYGLRGAIGKDLDAALQTVWMNNTAVRKAAAALKARNRLKSNIEATEEVLADLRPQDLAKLSGWRRVVKAVRDWLGRIGATKLAARVDAWLKAGLDEQQQADLFVADLVTAARAWVKSGKGRPTMYGTLLADGSLAEDVAAQEKWLTAEAKARGYKSIDELAEKNYKAFENLAKLWRDKRPVDGALLSRALQSKHGLPDQQHSNRTLDGAELQALRRAAARLEHPESGITFRVTENGSAIATGPKGTRVPDRYIRFAADHGLIFEARRLPLESGTKAPAMPEAYRENGALYFGEMASNARPFDRTGKTRFSRNSQTANQSTAAQRAEEIISKPAATWRPLDAVARTLTHAVRLDALTSGIYDRAARLLDRHTPENIKAGVISDYGVPEAVLDQRTAMQGRMRVQLRKSGELIDKLATLTRAESRVAYEWMNNTDPQAQAYFEAQLPPESVKVMEEVKAMIDALSQEAVTLGQLDPEAFKRNRFEYLRRSYTKHTAELTKGETASRKRAIAILGDQYKGRGMTDAVDMAKFKNVAPEWWGRKLQDGKADKGLKGEKFIRLERRAPAGEGVAPLEQAQGPGETNPQKKGRLMEVAYWPAGEALPAKYSTWDQSGTWEVRDTKGGKLIVWRDFTKQERVAMGEIDEARYAIAKSLHGMIHDVETGRYLEWIATTYGKKPGEAIDGEIVEASERMRDVFKPGEWVQVPETKIPGTSVTKYGMLAGRYLPGPIWNDVRQTVGFRFKPLGETYAAILGAWKTSKTALSPAVHTNNVMANFVMADWHDVTAGHIVKALRIILGASQREGKGAIGRAGNAVSRAGIADAEAAREVINRFLDSGANLGSWVTAELQKDQLEPLLKALENEVGTVGQTMTGQVGAMVAVQKALQLRFPSAWDAFKPTKAGQVLTTEAKSLIDLYEAEDQVFRLAAWLRAKEEGAPDAVAGKMARRSFLDYHINAPWIQALRNSALPFISFTYRAVPMMLEVAAKKPHKLMKLALVASAINALGYLLSGGDEDDERRLLPEEKAGSIWGMVPKLVRMPWNDANGSPVFLDIRRFVPVGDIFDTGQNHAALPLLPFVVPGGPLAVVSELVANRSQFTGRPITLETDTPSEQAAKVADHLYKAFAPNIVILPGTHAWSGVSNAVSGRTDSFGREQSPVQATASAFGVKVASYPQDVLEQNAQRAAKAKMMEIERNITQLKREYQHNGIDSDEFQRRVEAQQEKKRAVVDRLQERMGGN